MDSNNRGWSDIICFGSYTDGRIWVELEPWENEIREERVETRLQSDVGKYKAGELIRGQYLPTHQSLQNFDGRKLHCTEAWTGDRFAVIFFCNNRVHLTTPLVDAHLRQLGFPLPGFAKPTSSLHPDEQAVLKKLSGACTDKGVIEGRKRLRLSDAEDH